MTIKTFAQMIAVLESMATNLPTYSADLATTVADQTFLDNSLANANFIQDYAEMMDTNKKAYFGIKQRFYNGDPGLIAAGPATAAYAPPFPMTGDVHGDLMKLIGRIVDANKYKEDPMGIALGIAGDTPVPPDPATLKLTLEAFPGQSGYLYTVVVGNRGGYEMWELEVQPVGAGTWTNVGRFDGKSQDVTYVNASPSSGPVQINLRVRAWKAGSHVGLYSDVVTITVNP